MQTPELYLISNNNNLYLWSIFWNPTAKELGSIKIWLILLLLMDNPLIPIVDYVIPIVLQSNYLLTDIVFVLLLLMREGMALVAFPDTVFPALDTDLAFIHILLLTCYTNVPPPEYVSTLELLLRIADLFSFTMEIICIVFTFPIRIYCSRGFVFVAGCPCSVWGQGLIACPLNVGPFFSNPSLINWTIILNKMRFPVGTRVLIQKQII